MRRVGGATGVFWEACVGVASRASPRAADQTTGISKAAMYCSAARGSRGGAAGSRLAAVKATLSDAQRWNARIFGSQIQWLGGMKQKGGVPVVGIKKAIE